MSAGQDEANAKAHEHIQFLTAELQYSNKDAMKKYTELSNSLYSAYENQYAINQDLQLDNRVKEMHLKQLKEKYLDCKDKYK